jgi:hypothetical protein
MKVLWLIGEYLFGILTLLLTLITIVIGLFVSLFELPKAIRNKMM